MKFFLPWPDRTLSPNSRPHWAKLAKAKRKAKDDAYYAALAAGFEKIDASRVTVRYSFFPPSKRRYDMDNLIASMKAASDGISLAIGVDDSLWHIEISPRGPIEKHGMVMVQIEWDI